MAKSLHPSVLSLLAFFKWNHLPPHLAIVSQPFAELAWVTAHRADGPETTTALRKLLEAKDAAVRAVISPAGGGTVDLVPPVPAFLVNEVPGLISWALQGQLGLDLLLEEEPPDDDPACQLLMAMGFALTISLEEELGA